MTRRLKISVLAALTAVFALATAGADGLLVFVLTTPPRGFEAPVPALVGLVLFGFAATMCGAALWRQPP